jgi:hypothetical protein
MKLEHSNTRVWLDNDVYIEELNNEWEHCPFPDFDQLFYNRQRAEVESRYPALKGLVDSNEDYQISWKLPKNLKDRRRIIKQILNR